VIGPDASAKAPRVAVLALAVLATGAGVLSFVSGLIRPSQDFATMYAAARAVADNRAANLYDFATLAQLNAAHHYVNGPIYPFTYPPFTLLALRPLALLSFDVAHAVWSAIVYAALLGTALLADAFVRLLRHRHGNANARAHTLIEATALPVGNWTFSPLPFAITTAVLLLTLPLFDAAYWGQATIIVVFLLALALHAAAQNSFWLAGAAGGLTAAFAGWEPVVGISVLALLVLLAFLLQGYWKAAVAGTGAVALVALMALFAVPPDAYSSFASQQSFLSGVYLTNGHNTSLSGLVANILTITEHTNTGGLVQGQRLAQVLSWAITVISILVAASATLPRLLPGRNMPSAHNDGALLWPLLALLLTVPLLAAPLVWPAEAMVTSFAALALLGYLGALGGRSIVGWLAAGAAALALLLCTVAAVSGSDLQNLPQGEPVLALYLLRPLAALSIWIGALAIVVSTAVGQSRGSSAGLRAQPASNPSIHTTTQA
jgi:hypothetical protein